jgi:hypothetical protein
MKAAGRFHLTYCTNIHPGETWGEVSAALARALPQVRRTLGLHEPLGVGLRLSAAAAETLEAPRELARFQQFLRDGRYYVFTINGFPYGAFHGGRVKERVYEPDWRAPARLSYTDRLARILAALLADHPDVDGSVSTVPGAFKPRVRSDADARAIASGMLQHAAHLRALREETGRTIVLAIEPEPECYLETVDDVVRFFDRYLFDARLVADVARAGGRPLTVDAVRRHVGVCFDACHMAVEFEPIDEALSRLRSAGITIAKCQLSSALCVRPDAAASARRALASFADDTYLHQVVARDAARLVRYLDLPDALADAEANASAARAEWRIHFHVPIFMSGSGELQTTQDDLAALVDRLRRDPLCPYLEVETYTWDVLPPEYRTTDVCTAIARELAWVRDRLES